MKFLNISNHPSDKWCESQNLAVSRLSGETIVDIKFPNVATWWDAEGMAEVAQEILANYDLDNVTGAMVAGEPIMCIAFVRCLQAAGITCYSAASDRVVEEIDGEKRSRFTFVQFRKWPTL